MDGAHNIHAPKCPGEQAQDNRRRFAFANPTGICRERAAIVGDVAARGWGLILLRTAMVALRTDSLPIASRALTTLVKVGEARRIRIAGTNACAWGTTTLLSNQYFRAKPGTRYFPRKSVDVWKPHKEFAHDQLALRVLCGLAAPSKFLTEPELTNLLPSGAHVADGILRLVNGSREWVLELQVEKSRKTGSEGGWAKLARRIVAICRGEPFGRWNTPLGAIEAVLVVASIGDGRKIADRVRRVIGEDENASRVWFLFAETTKDDGTPVRRYSDIHPFSPLGPVRVWHLERDTPDPGSVAEIWTPRRKTVQMPC